MKRPVRHLRKAPRGAALIVTLLLLTVLLVIGAGIVRRTQHTTDATAEKRRYDASVSCAEGAREMLLGQFRAFGVTITDLQMDTKVGDRRLASGHYDQFDIKTVRSLAGSGAFGTQAVTGTSNRMLAVGLGGVPYVFTVVCSDAGGRQTEVEFFIRFGL